MVKRLTSQMRLAGGFAERVRGRCERDRRRAGLPLAGAHHRASSPRTPSSSPPRPRWPGSATDGTLGTEVLGTGELDTEGVYRGSLYLRGGGDPTFGSRRFTTRSYGGGATVQDLADALDEAGIQRVTGRVYGDESAFDSLRGGPDSGYGVSIWVGPLSGLSYNRGLFTEGGRGFQANPPAFAAARLDDALEARHIPVRLKPRAGAGPGRGHRPGERRLAAHVAADPAHEQAVRQLLRRDAAQGPRHTRPAAWAPPPAARRIATRFARRLGARPAPRGRLGPLARRPRLAVQHREAAGGDALGAPTADDVRRLALHRGQRRHPLRPHAARSRPPALHRKDRHAVERQRAVRLLRGDRAATTTPTPSS